MKPLIKVRMGSFREAFQWIIRFVIIAIISLLIYKIYPINPFFVNVFGGIIFIFALIIPDEKILADEDVLIVSKYFCFTLFRIQKVISLDEVKTIIVAGNHNRTSNLSEIIMPYVANGYSSNEIRVVLKNEDVKTYRSAICLKELKVLESKLNELIEAKNTPNSFSQPIYRAE